MTKKTKRQILIDKLDKEFSRYVRMWATDENGYVDCATCSKTYHWTKIQNGHFQSRRFKSTRWDEMNCAPQCPRCNNWGAGEQYKMAQYLDIRFGIGTAEMMEEKARIDKKWQMFELEEMYLHYKELAKRLENSL